MGRINYVRPYKLKTDPQHPHVHKTTREIIEEKRSQMQQQFQDEQQIPNPPTNGNGKPDEKYDD
eukprot:3990145-Prorocentrum_lima.AAC.1